MHNLIVCAVFKNEAHILDEWIRHYLVRGVDRIYLVNDFSTDGFAEITKTFGDLVVVMDNDIVTNEGGRQMMICEKYFRPILSSSKWVALVDLDEFLYSPETMELKSVIERYNDHSQILANWVYFGSSGHVYQPHSVVEGFRMCAPMDTTKTYYSYKSIFKGDSLVKFNVHSHEVTGSTHHEQSVLLVNHYAIQSLNFFMTVKAMRGDVNNHFPTNGLVRDRAYFDGLDINVIEDRRLWEQNREIIEVVKRNCIESSDEVTMTITSCNRAHLLDKTLESFVKMNIYPIKETYIIDDSGVIGCNDAVGLKYPQLNIRLIYNAKNIGQVQSIEKMYSYVRTKWIFHCEEDWEFTKPGFIEKSKQVFDENPNEKIFTVWMRAHNDSSGHPVTYDSLNRGYYEMKRDFTYVDDTGKLHVWGGITFNPGLRRTETCYLFHPYTLKCGKIQHKGREYSGEYPINTTYREAGYYSMTLGDPSGHVRHIGSDFHIPRDWENNDPQVQPSHASPQPVINLEPGFQQSRKKYIWNVRIDRNR
jgi:glycosyltransferase involved in cell wall biosynthesis